MLHVGLGQARQACRDAACLQEHERKSEAAFHPCLMFSKLGAAVSKGIVHKQCAARHTAFSPAIQPYRVRSGCQDAPSTGEGRLHVRQPAQS